MEITARDADVGVLACLCARKCVCVGWGRVGGGGGVKLFIRLKTEN